ncbi:MAG: hypothetical protein Q9161_004326 [Pseudevernia consocians]
MALISIAVSWGFGRHLTSLDPTRSIQAIKYNYIQQPLHVMSSCFGRISFALFLIEIIQKFPTRRRFLYSLAAIQLAVNGSTAIIIMVQCRPIQALWNHEVKAVNVVTDFTLAVFPATFIWQLNMKLRKKVGLIFVMSLGILLAICLTFLLRKFLTAHKLQLHGRYNYQSGANQIPGSKIRFHVVEQYVIIIAASIPITMPALRWIGEKLSRYKSMIASWLAIHNETETAEYGHSSQLGQRSLQKVPDIHIQEYILPKHALGSGEDLKAVTSRDTE